jgi:hypothetical protein
LGFFKKWLKNHIGSKEKQKKKIFDDETEKNKLKNGEKQANPSEPFKSELISQTCNSLNSKLGFNQEAQ